MIASQLILHDIVHVCLILLVLLAAKMYLLSPLVIYTMMRKMVLCGEREVLMLSTGNRELAVVKTKLIETV